MTQAMNLANFANNLDTSGGLNPTALNAATPISKGGTAATTAAGARSSLSAAVLGANNDITSLTGLTTPLSTSQGGTGTSSTTFANLTSNVTGTLPIANGGTGATSLTANNVLLGNGTSALQVVAPSTSGNVLTSNGTTWTSSASQSIGIGQTWTNMLSPSVLRAIGTTYTNSTGRPIQVSITIQFPAGFNSVVTFTVGGVVVASLGDNAASGPALLLPIQLIIPASTTYVVTATVGSPTLSSWAELR